MKFSVCSLRVKSLAQKRSLLQFCLNLDFDWFVPEFAEQLLLIAVEASQRYYKNKT